MSILSLCHSGGFLLSDTSFTSLLIYKGFSNLFIFKFAGLGNDAYNAMIMALSDVVGIPYARFFAIFSVGLFVIELIAGRHFIGLGTIINTLFLGYIDTFFVTIQ